MNRQQPLWGILDTRDQVWMGENASGTGPAEYTDEKEAQVAAQVLDMRLDQEPGRCRARLMPQRRMRLRDERSTRMSGASALDRLEKGQLQ